MADKKPEKPTTSVSKKIMVYVEDPVSAAGKTHWYAEARVLIYDSVDRLYSLPSTRIPNCKSYSMHTRTGMVRQSAPYDSSMMGKSSGII